MPKYKPTAEDLYRKLNEVWGGNTTERRSLSVGTGDAGSQGGQKFINPLTTLGDIIKGGESGALTRLGIGTEDQVLTVVDDSGDLVPQWADATGGTPYTDEMARDAIGAALTAGTGITVTPNDGADTITIASTITQYTDEMARDALGTALVAGTNITITPNDGADTITIDAAGGSSYTDEQARDAIGTALVAGNNIDITVNDGADTITIDVEALTSADLSDFTEAAQDAIGTSAGAGFLLDTSSVAWTYTDATPSLVVNVKDEYVQDTIGAMFADSTNIDVTYNDGGNAETIDLTTAAKTSTINFIIDGGGSVITAGVKGVFQVDFAGSIVSNTCLADQSGSSALTIKKSSYSGYPGSLTSIVASAKPTLS
jgi:hypothetical protein